MNILCAAASLTGVTRRLITPCTLAERMAPSDEREASGVREEQEEEVQQEVAHLFLP